MSGRLAMRGLDGSPTDASRCSSTRSTPHTNLLMSLQQGLGFNGQSKEAQALSWGSPVQVLLLRLQTQGLRVYTHKVSCPCWQLISATPGRPWPSTPSCVLLWVAHVIHSLHISCSATINQHQQLVKAGFTHLPVLQKLSRQFSLNPLALSPEPRTRLT